MSESTPPSDAFLHQLLRFAPTAKMFYSGTLCGVSPDIDGLTQGCLHLLSRGELLVNRLPREPLRVHAPSVVLLPRPLEHRVEGAGAAGVDLMCAKLTDMAPPLSLVIPALTVIDVRSAAQLRRLLELMFEEAGQRAYGHSAAIGSLLQYTLVAVIRHLVGSNRLEGGVLDAMADIKLRPVLEALHTMPELAWTIETMAARSNLSRSAFAQRFTQVLGMAPLAYLTAWRMNLARELLESGLPVKTAATRAGYQSVASFTRAFARASGAAPAAWQRMRLGPR